MAKTAVVLVIIVMFMVYDPQTTDVTVLQTGNDVPKLNGIAIGTDQTHLMDTSTRPCKLLKHWIRDTKISASEPAGLPRQRDS
jgi:hypothetical protein